MHTHGSARVQQHTDTHQCIETKKSHEPGAPASSYAHTYTRASTAALLYVALRAPIL